MAGGIPPVGALVRRPAILVRRRVMAGLHAAGFPDFLPGHLAVFAHPGPEGSRPGQLAARAGLSKQAMNHLLTQLERSGYLVRRPDPRDRRTRVVSLTERGNAALAVIQEVTLEVEGEWARGLGQEVYVHLRTGLGQLDSLLTERGDLQSRG